MFRRKRTWSNRGTVPAFPWRDWRQPRNTAVRIACPSRYSNQAPLEYKSRALFVDLPNPLWNLMLHVQKTNNNTPTVYATRKENFRIIFNGILPVIYTVQTVNEQLRSKHYFGEYSPQRQTLWTKRNLFWWSASLRKTQNTKWTDTLSPPPVPIVNQISPLQHSPIPISR